jgi:hypothetical protein
MLWLLCSLLWAVFVVEVFGHQGEPNIFVAVIFLLPPTILFLAGLGLTLIWERFGEAHWLRLPENLRRGVARLYLVVAVPWVAWYIYQIFDAGSHHDFEDDALSHAFRSLLIVPIGGPILFWIVIWILAGFRKSKQIGSETSTAERASSSPAQDATRDAPSDFEAGKALGQIFVDLDKGSIVSKMRDYGVPNDIAACEVAFARVAIIKDTVKRSQPSSVANQILLGVNQYVAQAFGKGETLDVFRHYGNQNLSAIAEAAIRFYQEDVLSVTRLSEVLATRLSLPVSAASTIAPMLESVSAEADRLIKLSGLLQNFRPKIKRTSRQ